METIETELTSGDFPATRGTVEVHRYSGKERFARAFFYGTAGIMISAMSFIIPILHFIITPILLIITATVVVIVHRVPLKIIGGSGPCPGCSAPIPFAGSSSRCTFSTVCPECGRTVGVREHALDAVPKLPRQKELARIPRVRKA